MSLKRLYFDSETVGLHGMPVLFQYAVEDGPISLYDLWKHPVGETLDLIEWMLTHTMIFFNASYDMFHLVKCYTVFRLCPRDWIPEEHIDEIALKEPEAQDGPCLKPAGVLDLLLHSRKGRYQSLMARDDVRIKRVPAVLAYALAEELEKRVQLDGIYFAKSADKDAPRWKVLDRKRKDGEIDQEFKDVVLKFSPAGGLKFLAEYAMGYAPKYHFKDVEPDRSWLPKELGYAPTALAISKPDDGWAVRKNGEVLGRSWPGVIKRHIDHWATRADARDYAKDDIVYTRALDAHFGRPEPNDDDSVLACMVAVVRWHGFRIDIKGIKQLLAGAREIVAHSPVNCNKPKEVRQYIYECMDETEKIILEESTCKNNLTTISNWKIAKVETCLKCDGRGCIRCGGTGALQSGEHPAAKRATEILAIKIAAKEIELYKKLILAGKFHTNFNVIGALSSRMSGAGGLNAQGIKHTKDVRRMFPLAWPGYVLCGGDFDSFEVTIADAVCNDPALRAELLSRVPCHKCGATGIAPCKSCAKTHKRPDSSCPECGNGQLGACAECEGTKMARKKIHALFGQALFPDRTYEDIIASDGTANDLYTKGKQGFFGTILYGGNYRTLMKRLDVEKQNAISAIDSFGKRFLGVKKWQQGVENSFCSMRQPGGIGSQVVWQDPADYCETFLGFRRYFTLENAIVKTIFDLANKPPKHWREIGAGIKVVRRDRVQTVGGAVQSALYGAAFAMQAANMRAAANHQIQSPGAQITKAIERRIWDLQPVGIHPLYVAPLNIHDEVMVSTHPNYVEKVTKVVRESVEAYRSKVPLIGMTWNEEMANWAEKKSGAKMVKIRALEMAA